MSLKLYLLRHAQATSSFDMVDKERPLSERGLMQAKAIATHLKNIDVCLCSSAARTMQTLSTAQENGAFIQKVSVVDFLYNATAGDLLSQIQIQQNAQSVLIVAHNPGIHQLANVLCNSANEEQKLKMSMLYAPATLSIFECDIKNWQDLAPKSNTLFDFITQD